jgi:ribose 1,5-bisphosphokinase PhnN
MAGVALGWQVLLIGGPSGVGKTYAAREVAKRTGVSVLLADDVRLAFQRLVDRRQMPRLHRFLDPHDPVWASPEGFRDGLIDVGRILSFALNAVIDHHLEPAADAGRVIIEGDVVLPELARADRRVRTVMVLEPMAQVLRQRMLERARGTRTNGHARNGHGMGERGPSAIVPARLDLQARGSALFSRWLEQEAAAHGVPTVRSAPLPSLPDRLLEAIHPREELRVAS